MHCSKCARIGVYLASLVFVASPGYAATWTSEATAAFSLNGRTLITVGTHIDYGLSKSLNTVDPLTSPAEVHGSISGIHGGIVGVTENKALIEAWAYAEGGAGLMRAKISGKAEATWIEDAARAEARIGVRATVPATATAGWKDAYLVTGDPLDPHPGRPLLIQAFLNVSGGLNSSASGLAVFSSGLKLTAKDDLGRNLITIPPPHSGGWAFDYRTGDPDFNYLPRPAPATIPLLLMANEGQAREMDFQMVISVGAVAQSTGVGLPEPQTSAFQFNADYSHTLSWGGITSVVDAATGDPVSGWSIRSASGVDYSQAVVPEPASGLLMLLGVGSLLTRRSRS